MKFFRGTSASDLAHQFGCALRRSQNHVRIYAALESIACVALQIQIARGPANTCWQKIRGLEQDVFRGVGHTRFFASHDAADSNSASLIGDDAVVSPKRVSLPVEREKFLAL